MVGYIFAPAGYIYCLRVYGWPFQCLFMHKHTFASFIFVIIEIVINKCNRPIIVDIVLVQSCTSACFLVCDRVLKYILCCLKTTDHQVYSSVIEQKCLVGIFSAFVCNS